MTTFKFVKITLPRNVTSNTDLKTEHFLKKIELFLHRSAGQSSEKKKKKKNIETKEVK